MKIPKYSSVSVICENPLCTAVKTDHLQLWHGVLLLEKHVILSYFRAGDERWEYEVTSVITQTISPTCEPHICTAVTYAHEPAPSGVMYWMCWIGKKKAKLAWQWKCINSLIQPANVCTMHVALVLYAVMTTHPVKQSPCIVMQLLWGCLWNIHSYLWPFEKQVTANLGHNAPHSLAVNVLLWYAWKDILI